MNEQTDQSQDYVSLVDLNLSEVPDREILQEGSQAPVKITSVVLKASEKTGNIYPSVSLAIAGFPGRVFKPIFVNSMVLPAGNVDADENLRRREVLKKFCEAFNIHFEAMERYVKAAYPLLSRGQDVPKMESAKGKQSFAILKVKEFNGDYSNEIGQYIDPPQAAPVDTNTVAPQDTSIPPEQKAQVTTPPASTPDDIPDYPQA